MKYIFLLIIIIGYFYRDITWEVWEKAIWLILVAGISLLVTSKFLELQEKREIKEITLDLNDENYL